MRRNLAHLVTSTRADAVDVTPSSGCEKFARIREELREIDGLNIRVDGASIAFMRDARAARRIADPATHGERALRGRKVRGRADAALQPITQYRARKPIATCTGQRVDLAGKAVIARNIRARLICVRELSACDADAFVFRAY
jgi:hypothetical protein